VMDFCDLLQPQIGSCAPGWTTGPGLGQSPRLSWVGVVWCLHHSWRLLIIHYRLQQQPCPAVERRKDPEKGRARRHSKAQRQPLGHQ
ncbi:hypothetical protein CHS0354_010872, partial [Potamilus streckersoni]